MILLTIVLLCVYETLEKQQNSYRQPDDVIFIMLNLLFGAIYCLVSRNGVHNCLLPYFHIGLF